MNSDSLHRVRALSALVAATVVAACGGGSDAPTPPPPPSAPASVNITGRALAVPLQGITACYDINDDKACDATELAGATTAADGSFTLSVLATEAGKRRVIVKIPKTAIDADGTAVGFDYTLMTPATGNAAAHNVVASPLSTLVQQQMDSAGQTQAEAVAFVQAQLGLAVSPLADFTAAANADNTKAANAARLTVSTLKQQTAALAPAVGQPDLSSPTATATQANVDALVVKAVAGTLPMIGGSATDLSLDGKTGTALAAAVTALATNVVAQIGLTVPEAVTAIGVAKLPPDVTAVTSEATAGLAALQYTDANHWFMRVNHSTALDNTPDSNGLVYSYGVRTRMAPYNFEPTRGVAESFAQGTVIDRAGDLHWNGSAWTACFLGQRDSSTPRDAQGRSSYSSCDNFNKGVTTRGTLDIAGLGMAAVITDKILPVVGPATAQAGGGNGWNLNTALLGTDTFPAGSKLHLQSDVTTETAPAYDVRPVNQVLVFSQAVADGGDARTGTVACATAGTPVATATLEEMVARFPGKPCRFNAATNADGTSLNPNEAWGPTSLSMGDVQNYYPALPAGTGNYYNNTGRMRVGFTGTGNGTVYYQCLGRRVDNSIRNCTEAGRGTYSVTTLGDARMMTFNDVPAALQRIAFTRVMVERGGKVYYGFRNPLGVTTNNVRLNKVAADTLLAKLGLPGVLPADAPKALTGAKATNQAAMKGVWYFSDAFGTGLLRVGDNGEYVLAGTDAPGATSRPGYERGWLDIDGQGKLSRLVALDTDGDGGVSHHNPAATLSVTDTTFTFTENGVTEGFDGRLPDSGTGIVGMWALGSATDLKVTQFVFFANGKLLSIHPAETEGACATARQGPPGIEWSDYAFNAATGALTIFNRIYDTSGCTGVFDATDPSAPASVSLTLTMAADNKTFTVPVDGGTVVLTGYRIAPR